MGVLLLTGHAPIWEVFVLQAIGGAATAFYSPASSGLVPGIVPRERLEQAGSGAAWRRSARPRLAPSSLG
jgi:hypothetical protein